ncbi:hypothetical protein ES708_21271 [subsurface metagenome]
MRISTPITDYVRRSILTTTGDFVVRGAAIPERLASGAAGTYLQGKGAGVLPAYEKTMPPLNTQGDLLVQGPTVPEVIPPHLLGKVLTSNGAGSKPSYWSLFNLLTTQGDMWVQGAANPEKLVPGNQGTYLKGNGLAAKPFYGEMSLKDTGIGIGNFTRNSTGNEVVTGVGFKPSVVFFFAAEDTPTNRAESLGFDDGTTHMCLAIGDAATQSSINTGDSIGIYTDVNNAIYGEITSKDSNGFTVLFALTGIQSIIVAWLALP